MRETTPVITHRVFEGKTCRVSVTVDQGTPVVRVVMHEPLELDLLLTPEQFQQVANDLASAGNWVRTAIAEFKRLGVVRRELPE